MPKKKSVSKKTTKKTTKPTNPTRKTIAEPVDNTEEAQTPQSPQSPQTPQDQPQTQEDPQFLDKFKSNIVEKESEQTPHPHFSPVLQDKESRKTVYQLRRNGEQEDKPQKTDINDVQEIRKGVKRNEFGVVSSIGGRFNI